jgi:hypothetical protein
MAQRAVNTGTRVGVVATLPSTLEPTVALIKGCPRRDGKPVEVISQVVAGAFEAVMAGDGVRHDSLVAQALREMSPRVDVIVLAQASMARTADGLKPEEKPVPILSSPRLAVENLSRIVVGG